MDVVGDLDIPFDVRWDRLGARHGYIGVDRFIACDQVDHASKRRILEALPTPGRPAIARAERVGGLPPFEPHLRAPRQPNLTVKKHVSQRSGGVCEAERCARPAAHFDHIVPWARGGNSDLVNIQHLCVECNLAKRDTMPANPLPTQFWFDYILTDVYEAVLELGPSAKAAVVTTENSTYDVFDDGDVLAVSKRRSRRVVVGASRQDGGFLSIGGKNTVAVGVDGTGQPTWRAYLRTSAVRSISESDPADTLFRFGIDPTDSLEVWDEVVDNRAI